MQAAAPRLVLPEWAGGALCCSVHLTTHRWVLPSPALAHATLCACPDIHIAGLVGDCGAAFMRGLSSGWFPFVSRKGGTEAYWGGEGFWGLETPPRGLACSTVGDRLAEIPLLQLWLPLWLFYS